MTDDKPQAAGTRGVVYFAHGKESGPWGTKILALAEVAKARGCRVESPDYSGMDDPDERVRKLLDLKPRAQGRLILVGSSMGGYVSTVASSVLNPGGLFLMAPAFYIREYKEQSPRPAAGQVEIVHGWNDEVVPLEHSLRFAKEHGVRLEILNGDHRLTSVLSEIEVLFAGFLERVLGETD